MGITKDGRYGLCAPARGGLEVIEMRRGATIRSLIPRISEGVFTVKCNFTSCNNYVFYYHGGRKTIRVFRVREGRLIATYKVGAELSAIACSSDGRRLALGTVDGCLSFLTIADPTKQE